MPQQKCSAMALLPGWGLERFERLSYVLWDMKYDNHYLFIFSDGCKRRF